MAPSLAKFALPGGVVAMDVGVDEIADRRRADASDRRHDLVGKLRVLGIDHQDAVRPREHADPAARGVVVRRIEAARAGQHVEVRRHLIGDDLDLVEVDLLREAARSKRRRGQADHQ